MNRPNSIITMGDVLRYFTEHPSGKERFNTFVELLEIQADDGCDGDFVMHCLKESDRILKIKYYQSRLRRLDPIPTDYNEDRDTGQDYNVND